MSANENMSLFTFDQRGNGCSTQYPELISKKSFDPQILSSYGSRMIVSDSEILRKHFNIDKWTLFGQSYGGLIVQRYLELHPESVSKAVMHGTPIGAWTESVQEARFKAIATQYIVFSHLLELGFNEKVKRISELFPKDYCVESKNQFVSVCGADIVSLFVPYVRSLDRSDWKDAFIEAIVNLHGALVKEKYDINEPRLKDYFSQILGITVGDNENRFYWEHVITKQELTPGFTDSENGARLAPDQDPLISEARLFRAFNFSTESFNQVAIDPVNVEAMRGNLKKHPIDFYVFASEIDVVSPASFISEQIEKDLDLPNVIYSTFKDSGHGGYTTEPAVFEALK